jgi:hypothetical protein
MDLKYAAKLVLLGICAQLAFAAPIQAGTFTVFGPQTYTRGEGSPIAQVAIFQVPVPAPNYTLTIENGRRTDDPFTGDTVGSAVVMVNGTVVVGSRELKPKTSVISKPIVLSADNEISVELRGKPGGVLTIQITGEDNIPPTIDFTAPVAFVPNNNLQPEIVVEYADVLAGVDTGTLTILLDGVDITSMSDVGPASAAFLPPGPLTPGMHQVVATISDHAGNSASDTHDFVLNTPPTANDNLVETPEDTAVGITLTGGDVDGSALTFSVVSGPSHGELSGTAPNLTYDPNTDFNGTDGFTFTTNDGSVDSSPATVEITVTPVDDPPVAVEDAATMAENGPAMTIDVLGNDTDVDGGAISINSVTQPANGAVAITNAGADLTYLPNPDYCNDGSPTDDFEYTLNGGSTATVKLTVDCQTIVIELSDIARDSNSRGFAIAGGTSNPSQAYSSDWAGYSVDIAGDLNGDGLAEVLVGAPEADPTFPYDTNDNIQKGIAYVIWGKADGNSIDLNDVIAGTTGFAMSGKNGSYDLDTLLCNGTVSPCGAATSVGDTNTPNTWTEGPLGGGLGFGIAAAGDVDGDGISDIIASAPYAKANRIYQGKSYVLFGNPYDISFSVDAVDSGIVGFTVTGEEGSDQTRTLSGDPSGSDKRRAQNGDTAGSSVDAARAINGDGLADLLVTARNALRKDWGRTYVVFGKEGTATVQLADIASADDDSGFAIFGREPGALGLPLGRGWGTRMTSAGDFNRDGFGDVLAHPNFLAAFDSFVVLGSEDHQNVDLQKVSGVCYNPLQAACVENFIEENLVLIKHPFFKLGLSNTGRFIIAEGRGVGGLPVAGGGDINADGYSDLVFSGLGKNASSLFVVLGTDASTTIDLQDIRAGSGFGFEINSNSRNLITWKDEVSIAGDVNGDGFDDIVIGRSTTKVDGIDDVGRTYVVFGKADLAEVSLEDVSAGMGGFVINGEAEGDRSGFSVSSSDDTNGDGLNDIVIGAYKSDAGGNTDSGKAYVVFGRNFSGAITHLGGDGEDTLTGSPADDSMMGGRADDLMIGNGGADVFYAGAGDDTVRIADTGFRRINGGDGFDVLQLEGDGLALSLAGSRGLIDGFEVVDLGLAGNQALEITKLDLLNLSDTGNELMVFGPASPTGDTVSIPDGGWIDEGSVIFDGRNFTQYDNGRAVLIIETTVNAQFGPNIFEQSFNVDENTSNTAVVGSITASDLDGVITGYVLLSQSGAGTFEVNSTGDILVKDASQIDFESGNTQFTLTVEVADNDGSSNSATMTINVNDVNEPPTITGFSGSASIHENVPDLTVVATAHATDPDVNDSLTFAIISGNDAGLFAIDASSGIITVADGSGIDFEQSRTHTLDIQAADSGSLSDTQSLTINVQDLAGFTNEATLTYSTIDRSIFSDDLAFIYDLPETTSVLEIPAGDPTVVPIDLGVTSTDISMDFAGIFTFIYDIDLNAGAFNANIPIDFKWTYLDEVQLSTPFAFNARAVMQDAATISGNTPGYSIDFQLVVDNLRAVGDFGSFRMFDQGPYSMDPNPRHTNKPATFFNGGVVAANTLRKTGVEVELYDRTIDWDSYLDNALSSAGLPSNEGTINCEDCVSGFETSIDYIVYSFDILANMTVTQDFTLTYDGIDATMTLENGSTIPIVLGRSNLITTNITLPADADQNNDGRVDFTIDLDIDTSFTNATNTAVTLGKTLTAGFFGATLIPPIGGPITIPEKGPLITATASISPDQDNNFSFKLGGFNNHTITGSFDLSETP